MHLIAAKDPGYVSHRRQRTRAHGKLDMVAKSRRRGQGDYHRLWEVIGYRMQHTPSALFMVLQALTSCEIQAAMINLYLSESAHQHAIRSDLSSKDGYVPPNYPETPATI